MGSGGSVLRCFWCIGFGVDESHFTIAYELGEKLGTIDGWLEPEGDYVRMKIRDGSAKEE
jgi:hypothetical protein